MKIIAAIPARYQSVRFPGKPLALIKGRPMIEWVYRQVAKCKTLEDIVVATDDKRIAEVVASFGGKFVMTSGDHSSGTDRIWEMFSATDYDGVINIQGDEPVISENLISKVCNQLSRGQYPVVSAAYKNNSYVEFYSPNVVKVIVNFKNEALYFSRSPIPHTRKDQFSFFHQHIGIYGYTRDALCKFINFPKVMTETAESLEQLRFLENSVPVYLVESEYPSIGVDQPSDIDRVERWLDNQENMF